MYNLRFLYAFGALTRDRDGRMCRTDGIIHSIKEGIIIENRKLLDEVATMVAKSKQGLVRML